VHLAAARANPAAAVRRQQEADVSLLLPSIQSLTERQHQLFFLFQSVIGRHQPDGLVRLTDADVAEAAGSVAATLETSARGVIYEHPVQSAVARKLAVELRALLEQIRGEGATVSDREAALTLRAIEQGATTLPKDGADTYLNVLNRLLQLNRSSSSALGPDDRQRAPGSSIILP